MRKLALQQALNKLNAPKREAVHAPKREVVVAQPDEADPEQKRAMIPIPRPKEMNALIDALATIEEMDAFHLKLGDWKLEVDERSANVALQIHKAKAQKNTTGIRADGEWFTRALGAKHAFGKYSQALQHAFSRLRIRRGQLQTTKEAQLRAEKLTLYRIARAAKALAEGNASTLALDVQAGLAELDATNPDWFLWSAKADEGGT
jgi:hypothetical protein